MLWCGLVEEQEGETRNQASPQLPRQSFNRRNGRRMRTIHPARGREARVPPCPPAPSHAPPNARPRVAWREAACGVGARAAAPGLKWD